MINLLRDILINPLDYEWSVQGLGMMRTYLSEDKRLHIWHSALQTPGASRVHDHPWHFTSLVVFGEIHQYRYIRDINFGTPWKQQRIMCGEHGGVEGEPEIVRIRPADLEIYKKNDVYQQKAHELHDSIPVDNTVTIITRDYLEDLDHAYVLFPLDKEFVSAIPRPATRAEVLYITREVLRAHQEIR